MRPAKRDKTQLRRPSKKARSSKFELLASKKGLEDLNLESLKKICDWSSEQKDSDHVLEHCTKIDLSGNMIQQVPSLPESFSFANLTSLSLAGNQLGYFDASFLKGCSKLSFLNISKNNISKCIHFECLPVSLRTILANENQIRSFPNISHLKNISTLVISSNLLKSLDGIGLSAFEYLSKLSASSNRISEFPSDLKFSTRLRNLRLCNNRITQITPKAIPQNVKLLDLSKNDISALSAIDGAISSCIRLENLCLRENPVVEKDIYPAEILKLIKTLVVLDNLRVGEISPSTASKKISNLSDGSNEEFKEPAQLDSGDESDGISLSELLVDAEKPKIVSRTGVASVQQFKTSEKPIELLNLTEEITDSVGLGGSSSWD